MAKFRLDATQRQYFSTLCSVGSITQAAQTLYLTRQGLSKSMKSLEAQVGAQLFERGKNGVELTEAGRVLLAYTLEESKLWDECLKKIRESAGVVPEPVRVGLLSMYVGYDEKRALFADYRDDHRVKIEIVDGDHDDYWRAIASGDMEFAFSIRPSCQFNLPMIDLDQNDLSILLNVEDPLAANAAVDFETDLAGKTVIQTSPYKGRLYEATFRERRIETERLIHDKNLMLARVSTSLDCFIIQNQYAKALVTDQVCMRPLVNAPLEMGSFFVFRPDLSPVAREVAKGLLAAYGKEREFESYFDDVPL
jgi:DNA-binding transcriptional LysR family regulator